VDSESPEPRYWAVFNVIGPNGGVGDQVAYDAEGGVVEMATGRRARERRVASALVTSSRIRIGDH